MGGSAVKNTFYFYAEDLSSLSSTCLIAQTACNLICKVLTTISCGLQRHLHSCAQTHKYTYTYKLKIGEISWLKTSSNFNSGIVAITELTLEQVRPFLLLR